MSDNKTVCIVESSSTEDMDHSIPKLVRLRNTANIFYKQNNLESALHYDKIYIKRNAFRAYKVAEKWRERGHEEISKTFEDLGLEIAYNDPDDAEWSVALLIDTKRFTKAHEVGNKVLEKWAMDSDTKINEGINNKMALAIKIDSPFHYYIFRNKLTDIEETYIVHNFYKYFENKSLKIENKDSSSIGYFINRTYIDQNFLIENKLTIDEARGKIIAIFSELQNKNKIISVMLQAAFVHAKKDLYFKVHIFNKIPNNGKYRGMYRYYWDSIEICKLSLEGPFFKELLMHEIYHLLMYLVFQNKGDKYYDGKPYLLNDKKAKKDFKMIIKKSKLNVKCYLNYQYYNPLNDTFIYPEFFATCKKKELDYEFLAYFIEIATNLDDEDLKKQNLLKPMYNYWMKYIQPRIKQYIKDYSNS